MKHTFQHQRQDQSGLRTATVRTVAGTPRRPPLPSVPARDDARR